MKDRQIINVQVIQGRPETRAMQLAMVENHPEATESGTCKTCAPLDAMPVAAFGVPPFHPNCVCTVAWKEVK